MCLATQVWCRLTREEVGDDKVKKTRGERRRRRVQTCLLKQVCGCRPQP
jgi:hypothetical protein